jgi:CHAT domain-containing protein
MRKRTVILVFLALLTAANARAETYCGGDILHGLRMMQPYLINETTHQSLFTRAQCTLDVDLLMQGKRLLIKKYLHQQKIPSADFDLLLRLMERERKVSYQRYFDNDCIPFSDNLAYPDKAKKELILYFNANGLPKPVLVLAGYDGTRQVIELAINQESLVDKTLVYFNQLADKQVNFEGLRKLSAELYGYYLRPVAAYLQSGMFGHLTIVQDTQTQLIPFESLYDAENQEYVLQKPYSISYRPNLSRYAHKASAGTRQTAIIAYPSDQDPNRDNHQREADAIATIAPGSTHLSGTNFSTPGILNRLNNAPHSILHISSHAEFKTPFAQSMIALDGGKQMQVADLEKTIRSAALRNNPLDLLVLSACQTARSYPANQVTPEDMIQASLGLAGVAARSGAKSVIASLWNVAEADRVLIDTGVLSTSIQGHDFYSIIQRHPNRSKAKALQQAKLNFMQDEYIKHRPYLWSAYILIGEPDA